MHLCDSMWRFLVEANLFSMLSFVYICIAIGDLEGRVVDSINRFNPDTLYAFSSQDLILQRHKSWSFCVQWVQLRWEVIIRFVDIGGINDHQRFILFS
jgi:hypothetical protein